MADFGMRAKPGEVVDLAEARRRLSHREIGRILQPKPICLLDSPCASCGREVGIHENCYWSTPGGLRCTGCGPYGLRLA